MDVVHPLWRPELSPHHGHKTGAEAFDAGIVLVARRLIDRTLAPELGFQRLDRDAIGFYPAIAAPFTNQVVDHHPFQWVGERAAFAPAPLFSPARLIVDEDCCTLDLT
ncbi:hypothetical protein D3C81_1146580 [compost metagenome]